jgi:hypothetical protein
MSGNLEMRYVDQLALSLFDKEATYDAGPAAWLAANACSMKGFDGIVQTPDKLVTDKEGVTGYELPTDTVIELKDWVLDFTEPKLKPNTLAGLAALHFGSMAVTQDGAIVAYRHKATPVAAGTALPSIGGIYSEGGYQEIAKGIKSNTFSLKNNGAWWSLPCQLMGSGTRASDATPFPASISEGWMRFGKIAGLWIETGANISIDVPVQGSEAISSATPDNLTSRLLEFEFTHNNNLRGDLGYQPGGGDVRADLDWGVRNGTVKMVLKRDSATYAAEMGYYDNQDDVAVHLCCKMGSLIADGGAYYYGFDLIVPMIRLKPITKGVQDDFHTITLEGDIHDDGTNDEVILYTYNAQAAYLA